MKLFEFLEDYQGFDWQHGEIALFDQRHGVHKVCTVKEGEKGDNAFFWMGLEIDEKFNKPIWSWTHTEKTMLIVL